MNTIRKRNMRAFCEAIIVFCLVLNGNVYGAEAWMTEWERAIKAAELEGEVSYYTLGEVGFLSEFAKKFPRIKVKVVQGRGNLQNQFTSHDTPQRGSKVYGDVEGGMDGCRADAKSGQPGPGEKWQGAIGAREEIRANNPPRNRG
jgi:hypothetical protein